jgi:hypothetical protein
MQTGYVMIVTIVTIHYYYLSSSIVTTVTIVTVQVDSGLWLEGGLRVGWVVPFLEVLH